MKLRTLREIVSNMARNRFAKKPVVTVSDLRQEAIKWIKESRSLRAKGNKNSAITEVSWMNFFNIKEDDVE